MAEENQQTPPNNDGISEDELRGLIGNAVDEKLNERGLTKEAIESLGGIGTFVENLFKENKSEPMNEDGLLEKIGNLVDEKLKGISQGGGNGQKEHAPKIKIFG
jgi:hypothetical protein